MSPFSISCLTCKARLRVRDLSAVGQILACPKCGSMVEVVAPADEPSAALTTPPVASLPAHAVGHSSSFDDIESLVAPPPLPASAPSGAPQSVEMPASEMPLLPAASNGLPRWLLVAGGVFVVGGAIVLGRWLSGGAAAETPNVAVAVEPVAAPVSAVAASPSPALPASSDSETKPAPAVKLASPAAPVQVNTPAAPDPFGPPAPSAPSTVAPVAPAAVASPSRATPTTPATAPVAPPALSNTPSTVVPMPPLPTPTGTDSPPPPPANPPPAPPAVASSQRPADKLPTIDVAARLQDKMPAISFPNVPLAQFVGVLTQISTVPISFDIDAVRAAGVDPFAPVKVDQADATMAEVLEATLAARGLGYVVVGQHLVITDTRRRPDALETTRYSVADFSPAERTALAELVSQAIEPPSWSSRGGVGSARIDKGDLVVMQTVMLQREVAILLGKLRTARRGPASPPAADSRFKVESRARLATSQLEQQIVLNVRQPTPLGRIADQLHTKTGMQFLFDSPALYAAGRWSQSLGTLATEGEPLAAALARLLGPLGLTFRVVDERTVEVTSPAALAARRELEVYRVDDLSRLRGGADKLLASLVAECPTLVTTSASLVLDPTTGLVVAWQPQPVQRQLEAWLDEQRQPK